MASTAKTVLGVVPGLQAASLVAMNIPKNLDFGMKKGKKMSMKKQTKRMIKLGVTNMVGVGLIGANASMINSLS